MSGQEYQASASVSRLQNGGFVVGGIALVVSVLLAGKAPDVFFRIYLMSFLLILGITLGSLGC